MTHIEETDDIKNTIKNFCRKAQRYQHLEYERLKKKNSALKPPHLRIPIGKVTEYSKPYGTKLLDIKDCSYTEDMSQYNVNIQELVKLDVPNRDGDTELRGGEMTLSKQSYTKVKLDNTPLAELEIYSMSDFSSVMDKLGLEYNKLKFVPKDQQKYKEK